MKHLIVTGTSSIQFIYELKDISGIMTELNGDYNIYFTNNTFVRHNKISLITFENIDETDNRFNSIIKIK